MYNSSYSSQILTKNYKLHVFIIFKSTKNSESTLNRMLSMFLLGDFEKILEQFCHLQSLKALC